MYKHRRSQKDSSNFIRERKGSSLSLGREETGVDGEGLFLRKNHEYRKRGRGKLKGRGH